jgi:choline dehydrogenase-like flavoprotein
MITDARRLPPDFIISCDICLVGAGAAGIALAKELCGSGKDVVLLESGGTRAASDTQDLYKGEVDNPGQHGRLDLYRQRRFGGTTAVWGGRCAPLDDIDFEPRSYVPHSGWPITRKHLDPYYARAHDYCDLGAYIYEAKDALPHASELIPGFKSSEVSTDRLWRFSLPTDFSKAFGDLLSDAANVRVYLHATCLRIRARQNGGAVDYLEIATTNTKRVTVRARQYVLCAGGLETTRLLLVSNDVYDKGIGNGHDLLGRYYLSHITGDLGEIRFTPTQGRVAWDYEKTIDSVYCKRSMSITEATQRLKQLPNFRATLNHPPVADPRHKNGILSAMYLIKRYVACRISPEYSRALSEVAPLQHVVGHIKNLVNDSANLARFSQMWIRERLLSKRKLPSVMFESHSNTYTLHFDAEQFPDPDSRVTLSDTPDVFGIKRLRVHWKFNDSDVTNAIRSCQLITTSLTRCGAGLVLFDPELMADHIKSSCTVGSHHIGTTRMASYPSGGVVDENCRIHGVDNLYVASSSVFPTSGVANPTLTIVALAIRLADHLRLAGRSGELSTHTRCNVKALACE